MLTRREYLALTAQVGAAFALPRELFAQSGEVLTRAIPKTGEKLPIIGLGSSATFSQVAGAADIEAIKSVFTTMLEHGGTVFDTAPGYGASEEVAMDVTDRASTADSSPGSHVHPHRWSEAIAEAVDDLDKWLQAVGRGGFE